MNWIVGFILGLLIGVTVGYIGVNYIQQSMPVQLNSSLSFVGNYTGLTQGSSVDLIVRMNATFPSELSPLSPLTMQAQPYLQQNKAIKFLAQLDGQTTWEYLGTINTNSLGLATCQYIPISTGLYHIKAEFDGTNLLKPSLKQFDITVS